jgi:putative hemolysin
LGDVVGIIICVVASALYSGSETTLTSLGRTGAQRLLNEDPRRNRLMGLWVEHPYRALTAILVGNNIANITATALATKVAASVVGSDGTGASDAGALALTVAVAVMTFLILTFGEITPKTFSKAMSKRLAMPAIRFVYLSDLVFRPITVPYAWATRKGLEWAGGHEGEGVTRDDIEFMVNLGGIEGALDAEKERLLTSVFSYSDTTVREVMVPRVDLVAVSDDVDQDELLQTLVECGHSRLPVYHESIDEIVGTFYAKDLLQFMASGGKAESFRLADFLRAPVFVPATKKVDALLKQMREQRIHLVIVVDEFGGTEGVVTLEDIIEEFFGDILDEHDVEDPMILAEESGGYRCDARVDIEELEERLGLVFPEDHEYETLGGFLSDSIGSVPSAGETIKFDGFRFTVLESEPTHIVAVRVEPLPAGDGEGAQGEEEERAKEIAV